MDYEIKPTSRHELRLYAKLFRSICGFSQDEPIDPIPLLNRLPDLGQHRTISSSASFGKFWS